MPRTIDSHAHLVPSSFLARVARREFAGVTAHDGAGGLRLHFGDRPSRPVFPALYDLGRRLDYLNRHGIDVQIVSNFAAAFGYALPEESASAYCSAYNEEISRVETETGGILRGLATVPLQFPDAAAQVLREAVAGYRLHGVEIGTNIAGAQLDETRFYPFWTAAEEMGVPIMLHPINTVARERLSDFYLENFLGNPFDTTIAAARLMLGGVFDRFPGLRVFLVHGGGYTLFGRGRIEHGQQKRSEPRAAHPAGHYLRRNIYVDTVVFDPAALRLELEVIGSERILLGTDCPFDMGQDEGAAFVRAVVPRREQAAILGGNAARLF